MKSKRVLQARGTSVSILLAASTLLLLQLPGGGQLTATEPNEAMSEVPASTAAADSKTAELVDQRDYNTRVWCVREEAVLRRDDGTEETEMVERRVVEVGSGICYKDAKGNFQPSNPHWEATPEGFVLRECAYSLSAGKTLAEPIVYTTRGDQLRFRPAFLKASSGSTARVIASVKTTVTGEVDMADPRRLLFAGAFGELGDLEILAKKGSLHQNVILNTKPTTRLHSKPEDARLSLYTELSLDEFRGQRRGGKGVIAIKTTKRNGLVVGVLSVRDTDDIIVITAEGKMMRTSVSQIREISRNTQGVRIISLSEGDRVVDVAKSVSEGDEEGEEGEELEEESPTEGAESPENENG